MAGENRFSEFFQKNKAQIVKSHEAHKTDETTYGMQELPPGIENGIARLTDIRIDTVKPGEGKKMAGQFFFYMEGVVVFPKKHQGTKVEGLHTRQMEMLCNTPESKGRKTLDEHYAYMLNCLRQFGIETNTLGPDGVEGAMEALKKLKPYFKFRTWQGKPTAEFPNPRTNHSWLGMVEEDELPSELSEGADSVNDDTADVPPPKRQPAKPAASSAPSTPAKRSKKTEKFDEFGDLDSLLQRANEEDPEAQDALGDAAIRAGATEEQVTAAKSWEEVYKLALGISGGYNDANEASDESEDINDDVEPEKGDPVGYYPIDPKTKKPGRKQVDCEVVAVQKENQTVHLRNLTDKTLYKNVPWDELNYTNEE